MTTLHSIRSDILLKMMQQCTEEDLVQLVDIATGNITPTISMLRPQLRMLGFVEVTPEYKIVLTFHGRAAVGLIAENL